MLPGAVTATRGGLPTDSGDSIVTLDQVPRCSDAEYRYSYENEDPVFPNSHFPDSLASVSEGGISGNGMVSRFLVDPEINLKIYLWRGNPWNLEVDAVVNSTNELMKMHLRWTHELRTRLLVQPLLGSGTMKRGPTKSSAGVHYQWAEILHKCKM